MLRRVFVLGGVLLVLLLGLVLLEFALGPVTLADLRAGAMIKREGPRHPPSSVRVYKETATRPLRVHVFEAVSPGEGATVVLFHGGGFHSGWPDELFPLATALAESGHSVFVPEYRLQRADGVVYREELADCRDAVVWVEKEAATFGADPAKRVLGGSSAGAHLAAALTVLPAERERFERPPLGLILMAPYLDSSEASARFERGPTPSGPLGRLFSTPPVDVFEGRSSEFSPRAHLHPGMPPALVLAGEEDRLWPSGREFCDAMVELGVECVSRAYPGAQHAFALKGQEHHEAVVVEIRAKLGQWLEAAAHRVD